MNRAIEIAIGVLMYVLALGTIVCAHAAPCPPQGDAKPGTIMAHMNPLKNRTDIPGDPPAVSVDQMLALPGEEDEAREQQAVTLKGTLLAYKHEGPESCNCHSKTRKDFHIWIGDAKPRAIVVELSPPIQELRPDLAKSLPRLKGSTVCVTGWFFFDHEHKNQVGKSRGTQWEIHPVTSIAACQ